MSGPTSCGKSRFIGSDRARELTGLPADAPVLYPARVRRDSTVERSAFLHYNILRAAHRAAEEGADPATAAFFEWDGRWRRISRLAASLHAIVLVTDLTTLRGRVAARKTVEPDRDIPYRNEQWLALYERIDLDALYGRWREELRRLDIPFSDVDSTDARFPVLSR